MPGCVSDAECQVHRADTDGDGVIDPYDATSNPDGDRLTCATTVAAWCDPTTSRCRHEGTPDAEAGAPCTVDFDCEADGECIPEDGASGGWSDGYCIKLRCDIAGNDCAGAGKCQTEGFGIPVCVQSCEVAATAAVDDRFADPRDCRPGYSCLWDGSSGVGPANGGCARGNYNDVRASNVGEACVDELTCYSPFGLGQCRDFGAGDHCTLFGCGAPGMPSDVCGADAVCAMVGGSTTTLCIATCESADECPVGNGCWDTGVAGIATGEQKVCFPGCLAESDCRSGERCEGATATTTGDCVSM